MEYVDILSAVIYFTGGVGLYYLIKYYIVTLCEHSQREAYLVGSYLMMLDDLKDRQDVWHKLSSSSPTEHEKQVLQGIDTLIREVTADVARITKNGTKYQFQAKG